MTLRRTRVAVAAAACAGAIAVAAVAGAAEPSSGTVSKDAPSVSWTGLLAESAVAYNAFMRAPDAPCLPPACDSFALEVQGAGIDLALRGRLGAAANDGSYADMGFRVTAPDGSVTFAGGPAGPDREYKLVIRKAAAGAYTVDVVNTFIGSPGDYSATAELLVPVEAPAPVPSAPIEPTPQPSPSPSGEDAPATVMTIATRRASVRKLRRARRLAATLKTSGPVEDVAVRLTKGARTLARGERARIASKGRVVLRLKGKAARLRPGRYRLVATATDAQGRPTGASAPLRVRR